MTDFVQVLPIARPEEAHDRYFGTSKTVLRNSDEFIGYCVSDDLRVKDYNLVRRSVWREHSEHSLSETPAM